MTIPKMVARTRYYQWWSFPTRLYFQRVLLQLIKNVNNQKISEKYLYYDGSWNRSIVPFRHIYVLKNFNNAVKLHYAWVSSLNIACVAHNKRSCQQSANILYVSHWQTNFKLILMSPRCDCHERILHTIPSYMTSDKL